MTVTSRWLGVMFIVLLMLTMASLPTSGTPDSDNQQMPRTRATVEKELQDIDQQWLHAATVQDTDYLKRLFADGMFEVQKGGVVVTGAEMRRTIALPGRRIQISIDQVTLRGLYGNTAIITDRTTQEGAAPDGRKISGQYTVMRVLQKQNGSWSALGAEMTPVKASTAAKPLLDAAGNGRANTARNSVEQELMDLDQKWVKAAAKGDDGFLKGLFSSQMFEVQPDGSIAGVAELLKENHQKKGSHVGGYCDQIKVQGVYGDTAILTDRQVRKGADADGTEISDQWRVTRVFVKQKGKWRAVASAMTPIE